jgi:hypothetical protein
MSSDHWQVIEDALNFARRYHEAFWQTMVDNIAPSESREDIDAALAYVREQRAQPPVPVSEIRLIAYALKAWWTYGSEASLPSQTEIRDLEIVEQWLDAQPQE